MSFNKDIGIGPPKGIHAKDKERPAGEVASDDEVADVISNIFS